MPAVRQKKGDKNMSGKPETVRGVGLDVGTMNFVSARRTPKGVETRRMRDAFLDLPPESKKMLKLSGVSYVDREDEILILGDAALDMANVFGREARRPLSGGLVSSTEVDSLEVLGLLVRNVLGAPEEPGEHCYFSVPAAPVDLVGRDVVYHRGIFDRIVSECGYTPHSGNEAMAIIYSETARDGFSGIALSFGSGMTNIALSVSTVEGLAFSVGRGGDWIDSGAAKSVGSTQARMCSVKEKGIDLNNPTSREQEALAFYYKNLVEYVLDQIALQFKAVEGRFSLPKPIPIIVSGGTSLAGGFLEFFTGVFEKKRKKFPIQVSEIRAASDPLNAVAHGLLVQALQEYE